MVWPYGAYNEAATKLAGETGMPITLTLNDEVQDSTNNTVQTGRFLIGANPTEIRLSEIDKHELPVDKQRVMHIDLDYVYDKNTEQMNRNIDTLIDRVNSLAPTTVYLQAFSDLNGDGVAEALYFPNRHVEMRADIFSRVSWQLMTRANVKVYAWMPVLAFELKDKKLQSSLQVVSAKPLADKNHINVYRHILFKRGKLLKISTVIWALTLSSQGFCFMMMQHYLRTKTIVSMRVRFTKRISNWLEVLQRSIKIQLSLTS